MNAMIKCKDRTGSVTLLTPSQTTIVNFYEVKLGESLAPSWFPHWLGKAILVNLSVSNTRKTRRTETCQEELQPQNVYSSDVKAFIFHGWRDRW